MIEITIAQAIVVAFALIIATVVIAQPFRKKIQYMKLETPEITTLAAAIIRNLNEDRLAEHILGGLAMLIHDKERVVPKTPERKSRAGEIRKPSTLPENATEEEKRRLKNRLKTREYRAKIRASRSAESGRFVTKETAKKNPKTTTNETITRRIKRKK